MKILSDKTDFRDLICNSLHSLYSILQKNIVSEGIKEKLDISLIDNLYNILEKYVEDIEIEKNIKNLLRILSLRSEEVSKRISKLIIILS